MEEKIKYHSYHIRYKFLGNDNQLHTDFQYISGVASEAEAMISFYCHFQPSNYRYLISVNQLD